MAALWQHPPPLPAGRPGLSSFCAGSRLKFSGAAYCDRSGGLKCSSHVSACNCILLKNLPASNSLCFIREKKIPKHCFFFCSPPALPTLSGAPWRSSTQPQTCTSQGGSPQIIPPLSPGGQGPLKAQVASSCAKPVGKKMSVFFSSINGKNPSWNGGGTEGSWCLPCLCGTDDEPTLKLGTGQAEVVLQEVFPFLV